jgi:hypothetical protein
VKISEWEDSETEKQEILDLTKKTYGDDAEISNFSYFNWQYRNNLQNLLKEYFLF